MRKVLDPLACIPGVRRAMLFSKDGVPMTQIVRTEGDVKASDTPSVESADDASAFAGMAAGLLNELRRSMDSVSWDGPTQVVLRATRGTLVLVLTGRANISIELDRGMTVDNIRLPLEAVVARLKKALGQRSTVPVEPKQTNAIEEPPGIAPVQIKALGPLPEPQTEAGNDVPNTTKS